MTFRHRIYLDGTWQFQIDPTTATSVAEITSNQRQQAWRQAKVPLPWQAQFDDLRHTSGVAWYRRTFAIDERPTETAILHFNAVDYHAAVWMNGEKAGEHEGGYLPFEVDVTHFLRMGENELLVRVIDPTDERSRWLDYTFSEIPHGKQSWYGPISGIWQSVWLEWRPAVHFRGVRLTPHPQAGRLEIAAQLSFTLTNHNQVEAWLFAPDGAEVGHTLLDASHQGSIHLDPASIAWWSPDTPALYTVVARLRTNDQPMDEISATCGFRTVTAHDGRIYLNGQPIYLRGVLDQAYYPETIYTPPSIEFLEDQVRKAKALGLNCLRCHIKIEDSRYYEVADRLGILIWTEIPNWALLSAEAARRGKETFRQMVERDWNHPSIFAWTLINEDWGTDLVRNPDHRRWLADFYHEAKQIDPYRLIVDNSACTPNFHVASDLEDYHYYRAIPDHAAQWDQWVDNFARRADWAWAQDYLAERRPDLPLIVSEFGNWGLPHPDNIQEAGREPWWFETGHEWGDGIVYPHGMRQRFDFWQLGDVFGSFDQFIQSAQEHMARSLAYEISTMRLHPAIGGYVITEFTDVHWEGNGLLDMQRHEKHGLDTIFTPLNQDRVMVIRPQRWSGRPGEHVPVVLRVFTVDGAGAGGLIRWQAGEARGEVPAPGGVVQIPLAQTGIVSLQAHWHAGDGTTVAYNQVELACLEPSVPATKLRVLEQDSLSGALSQLGFHVLTNGVHELAERGVVLVANHFTRELQEAVQKGARLLLLAGTDFYQHEDSIRLPAGNIIARTGTGWQGDWATSFSWLKKRGPFAPLPGGPLLEMEYADMMPDAVITGLPGWAYGDHCWAGLALGWIHKPVALLAKVPYGRGLITMTTFKLSAELLTTNVVAQALMGGLAALA